MGAKIKTKDNQILDAVSCDKSYQKPLMDALVNDAPALSYFEFWPAWLFYFPMKIYGLYLGLRYGGMTLPTITNPLFDVGGFHGESKAQIHTQIPESLYSKFAFTVALTKETGELSKETLARGLALIDQQGWTLPVIVKPDIGMRGMGVQRIFEADDLLAYIKGFPAGATMILQDLYDYPCEVGLFYIRKPDEDKGRIFSLTLKQFSSVTGDGQTTLKRLIENHPRYGRIAHIYLPRHEDKWNMVLAKDEDFRIAFAGSHSRGTIFRDGNALVTPEMEAAWDGLAKQIPEFYFGRFDVRFNDFKDLETLENIKIVEVNGSGAEATHIWDAEMTLRGAYRTLMEQYELMYEIGVMNKQRGFTPMKLKALLARMKSAEKLADQYPHTH